MGHQNSNLNAGDTLSNYAENPLMVLCSSAGSMGLMIYILILGLLYPTPGGCTSLDNGDLPNQSGLDLGWWFEVYGAIGITFMLLRALPSFCIALVAKDREATTQILFFQF